MSDSDKGSAVMNEHQPSMTEWFSAVGEARESMEFRQEDSTKDERLEILYQTIGVQYERATNFPARDVAHPSVEFQAFLAEHGDDLCALRLVPTKHELPKLRNRGLSVRTVYETWFSTQDINPDDYIASFRPHAGTYPWSLIFVIGNGGVLGEMIPGQHAQLTHGDTNVRTTVFLSKDFTTFEFVNEQPHVRDVVVRALAHVRVDDPAKRETLHEKLNAQFVQDHLAGYYEAILWGDDVIRFGDFNRILSSRVRIPDSLTPATQGNLVGLGASPGVATGTVRIISAENIATASFDAGDILVTDNTDVRFVSLMQKAGAVVTARGGILSHASIIARELKVPCVVGVSDVTTRLENGMKIQVDGTAGCVSVLG